MSKSLFLLVSQIYCTDKSIKPVQYSAGCGILPGDPLWIVIQVFVMYRVSTVLIAAPKKSATKAERRRHTILESAERFFALHGFNATRLEDVAEDAGLTRPALFYHFPDKQALYQATLANAFGSLASKLEQALKSGGSIVERFEKATELLVEEVTQRPSLGRLIMRYVADAGEHQELSLHPESHQLIQTAWVLFKQGCDSGELKPMHEHPFHTASVVIGSTVFYTSAITKLIPSGNFDPLSAEHIAAQKQETLQIVRFLLGISPATA